MKELLFKAYKGKKVLVTGDTGFKGSWLSQWLLSLEATVYGIGLEPNTSPSLFEQLSLRKNIHHQTIDICDYDALKQTIKLIQPDIIFHLAAQALVRESYVDPLKTFHTNVIGTANIFEIIRELGISTNVVAITSDKCYENKEWLFGYREVDPMGGYDPYSASKGIAELTISSWRRSFFHPSNIKKHGVKIASARAGNVIGGGDWAKDRIVPDCIRSLRQNETINVRNPYATRPWQHVLEPLGGYLFIGEKLLNEPLDSVQKYCDGFNIGPSITSNKPVHELVDEIIKNWGSGNWTYKKEDAVHEASLLNLTIDKAYHLLDWQPTWDFARTIHKTTEWYKEVNNDPSCVNELTNKHINEYQNDFKPSHKILNQ